MSNSNVLSNLLHDATIGIVTIDWRAARVAIVFTLCNDGKPSAAIVASEFTELQIPRREPWGPSVSVNEANIHSSDGGVELKLQMQSGDMLRIQAGSITFTRSDQQNILNW